MKQNLYLKCTLAGLLLVFPLTGCAIVDPRADYDRTAKHIEQATGWATLYRPEDDAVIDQRVEALLSDGLTVGDAVQIALLNNPRLQAALMRLGISRADLVQSGLFTNPTLAFSLRWPDGGGLTNLQAGIAQNVAELWQIKHRKEAAEHELDRTILELAREASVLSLETRVAYWHTVRNDRERTLARDNLVLSQKLIDVAISRRDAGAGSDVDVNQARSQHTGLEIELRSAGLACVEAHAALAKLLGLKTSQTQLVLADGLVEPVSWTLSAENVIATAMESRLDVQATKKAVEAAQARIAYEKSRYLRSLELGLSAERSARNSRGGRDWLAETAYASAQSGQLTPPNLQPREDQSTDWVVGPEIGVELPIFDQNQAQIARAEYVYMQAMKTLDALERELRQDVHVALERARTAADNARFYTESVLPLREQGVNLAQGAYTAGRTTLLSVQESHRLLLEARSGYVETLLNYAVAIVELERASGRPFAVLLAALGGPNADDGREPLNSTTPQEKPAEDKP